MLFKNYNSIDYKIGSRTVNVLDIFKNVVFLNTENSKAFREYYIEDGETPETVSAKVYNTTEYSWLVMLVNNYASIKDDWFLPYTEEESRKNNTIGGESYYISALPDLKPGDIIVKVTATGANEATSVDIENYRCIVEFDPYFRRIRGICGSGIIETNDTVLFARQNPEDGTVTPITFKDRSGTNTYINYTDVLFKELYENSPLYFYNTYNVVIDPYRYSPTGITSINSNTLYFDTTDEETVNNFAKCLLYRYGLCGGSGPENLNKKTKVEDRNDKYLKKQKIRVLKAEYVETVIEALETALNSDTIGKNIKIRI